MKDKQTRNIPKDTSVELTVIHLERLEMWVSLSQFQQIYEDIISLLLYFRLSPYLQKVTVNDNISSVPPQKVIGDSTV